jgi:hypothetical protein
MFDYVESGFMTIRQAQSIAPDRKCAARMDDFGIQEFKRHACSPK